jgi:quinol monooxygenase YgiN
MPDAEREDSMYGTVARMRAKPGSGDQLVALSREYDDLGIRGFVATYVYRLDDNPDDYYMAVLFEDRESYRRNADDPAQDARYRRLRELLEADPKWHDGEVVWASSR